MENEKEFTEEELNNIFGGFQMGLGNEHPFSEADMFRDSKKEELEKMKRQLEEADREKSGKGRR